MWKRISAFLLALLILVVSVGVPIFTHICEEDGSSYAIVYNWNNDHCEVKKDVPACCLEDEKNCCSQETNIIKLKEDFNQFRSLSFHSFPTTSHCFQIFKPMFAFFISKEVQVFNLGPPPLLSGNSLRTLLQVWRI